jgi:hypothetical protein
MATTIGLEDDVMLATKYIIWIFCLFLSGSLMVDFLANFAYLFIRPLAARTDAEDKVVCDTEC